MSSARKIERHENLPPSSRRADDSFERFARHDEEGFSSARNPRLTELEGVATDMHEIPESILSAPLERFDLSVRSKNMLSRVDVTDVRALLELMSSAEGLASVRGLGEKSITELQDFADKAQRGDLVLGACAPPAGVDDEVGLMSPFAVDFDADRVEIADMPSPNGPLNLLAMLPQMVAKILTPSEQESIAMHFALGYPKRYSLVDIGIVRGFSRERARQIVEKGLLRLRRYLQGEVPRTKHVRPASKGLASEASAVRELLARSFPVLASECAIQRSLEQRYGDAADASALWLLLEVFGYDAASWRLRGLKTAWCASSAPRDHVSDFERLVRKIRAFLTDSSVPVSIVDLKIAVQKQIKDRVISTDELLLALEIDDDVEPCGEGWQITFARLPTQRDRAYRVLYEAGAPLDYHDLLRRLNKRLVQVGEQAVGARSVTNQMTSDPRIAPTGRSGQWGLVEWGIRVDTIATEMERFLHGRGEPAPVGEIVEHVLAVRPDVAKNSVLTFLSMREKFCRVGDGLYALTSWGIPAVEASTKTSSEEVRSKVLTALVALFDGVEEMPHAVLIRRIRERTGLAEATVTQALPKLPCLEIVPDPSYGGRKLVRYVPSRVSETASAAPTPVIEQVWATAAAFFVTHGGGRLKLAELVVHLQRAFSLKKPTIYAYLNKMPGLAKEYSGGTTWCVLARPEAEPHG